MGKKKGGGGGGKKEGQGQQQPQQQQQRQQQQQQPQQQQQRQQQQQQPQQQQQRQPQQQQPQQQQQRQPQQQPQQQQQRQRQPQQQQQQQRQPQQQQQQRQPQQQQPQVQQQGPPPQQYQPPAQPQVSGDFPALGGAGGDSRGRGVWGRGGRGQGPPQQGDSFQHVQAGRGPGRGGRGDGPQSGNSYQDGGRGRGGRGRGGRGQGDGHQSGGRGEGYQQQHSDRGQGRAQGRGSGDTAPQQGQDFPSRPSSVCSDTSSGGGRGRGAPISQPQSAPPPSQAADFEESNSDSSLSAQISSSMADLSLSQTSLKSSSSGGNGKKGLYTIPERKKKCDKNNMVGTRGRVIPIEVNHLLLTLKNTGMACHYDCAFKPDVPKKMLRGAMEEMRKKHYPKRWPAFDGRKNLYSAGELPFAGQLRDTVNVADEERDKPKEFDVTIKLVSHVDMSQISAYLNNGVGFPQDAIQALDIVLRNPSATRFTPVGRSFFTRPTNQILSLGDGLELWYGFYQSAILGWRPFLNVDVAHKGFPEPKSLLDVMLDVKGKNCHFRDPKPTLQDLAQNGLQRWELEDFNKFIKGLKVMYMIPGQPNTRRVYKMNGVKEPCIKQRFKLDDGRMITIGEYYEREKKYRLKFPNLNSIHVGSTAKDICVPPELCTIIQGQVVNRKLNENQTAAMVKAAARPADERKQRIMNAMRQAGFNNDKCISEFGVTVSQEFQRVNARVLDPPSLEYGGNNKIRARQGVWRAAQFLSSNRLERWVVMTLSGRGNEGQLRDFAKTMNQQGRSLGMVISEPCRYAVVCNEANLRNVNGMQLQRIIQPYFEQYKKENVQLVVVVIPDRPPDAYSKVKLTAEVTVGLLTQCIKERTMGKMNPATAGNILLKLNAKLNGVNHTVDRRFCPHLMDAPTMLVGADVTHPSPDQTTIPSVAAVAASHDRRAFQYNMVWRLQPPREEIILDLENIMREQLMFFYKKTGQKPLKIIFYRDGVSEGQFSQVLERELTAIRRACTGLQRDYEPRVTFLVVQKRHHTRFFPTRAEDEDGRNKNVPPGTIVDTMITHPKEMDFYLVSHASLQGTSRPTKYHKLWDESDIDEDDLEELTYYLCHLFSRCTRSVSYPAPTYYAHLAAFRGRVYLEGSAINLTNLTQEMNLRKIKENVLKDFPMFFV